MPYLWCKALKFYSLEKKLDMKPCKSIYFDNRPHPQEFLYPSKFHPPHRLAQNIGNTTFDPQEVWPCSQGVQFRRLHCHLSQDCVKSVKVFGQFPILDDNHNSPEKLHIPTPMAFHLHTIILVDKCLRTERFKQNVWTILTTFPIDFRNKCYLI